MVQVGGRNSPVCEKGEKVFVTFNSLNFTAKSILKKEFDAGRIPLKRDITGHKIKPRMCTHDHTIPKSKGGASNLSNYSLMDWYANNLRGSDPIKNVIDLESLIEYIRIMLDTKTEKFDGIQYLKDWLKTLQQAVKEGL